MGSGHDDAATQVLPASGGQPASVADKSLDPPTQTTTLVDTPVGQATVVDKPRAHGLPPRPLLPDPPVLPNPPVLPAAPAATGNTPAPAPPSTTSSPSLASASRGATTLGSPIEALESDEIARSRWFCLIAAAVGLSGSASVFILPGNATASAIVVSAAATSFVAIAFLFGRTRDRISFRRPSTLLGWFIPAACVTSGIPFFGPFSPIPLVLVLGVYFVGTSQNRALAWAIYVICAGTQGLVAGLVIFHVMPDVGLITAGGLSTWSQLVVQVLVQLVMAATIITARISRGSALASFNELERAVRVATQREALLLEAREELERALAAGRGRFSEQTIGGYMLGSVIGRGAMGEVYEATDPGGAAVAIKLLSQNSLGNPDHVMRFLRELRTAAQLISPYIVRVIDVGERPLPYLVMERLTGKTLSEILRARRVLPSKEVIELIAQVGAGITVAAAGGIVHRDLKPQNVFRHGSNWKILDFGVARAIDAGDTLTAGAIVGTPAYMAPEQARGAPVDHRSDLYALAAIAYRALTGQPPFVAGEIAETLYRVVHTAPRRPSDLVRVPPEIDLVLAIGLAKEPEARFATAAELSAAIAGAFAGNLPPEVLARGHALEGAGAWISNPHRA